MNISECLLSMKAAASQAGEIAVKLRPMSAAIIKPAAISYQHNPELLKNKSALSEADFECQKAIMESLLSSYSFCGVYAEENDPEIIALASNFSHVGELVSGKYTFLIDPIDGSRNYLSANSENSDKYGIYISLASGYDIVAGVVYYPELGTFITAEKGRGVFINGKRCKGLGTPENFSIDDPISVGVGVRHDLSFLRTKKSFNCACYNIKAMLNSEIRAYYTTEIPLLDFGFLALAVEEAGGFFGNQDSECVSMAELLVMKDQEHFLSGFILAACSRNYHRQLTATIKDNMINQ